MKLHDKIGSYHTLGAIDSDCCLVVCDYESTCKFRPRDIVENDLRCGLAKKDWLKPGTDHTHDTPSTDRRLGTLDIVLIRDEANVAAPRREPQIEAELTSLRTDVDAILVTPTFEPQAAPTTLADDTVLDALFSGTTQEGLERRQENEAKKASIIDEHLHQQRVRESVAGASSSAPVVEVPPVVRDIVSTTAGAMMDDVGTTEGDPTIAPAGFGKPDPPARA
uniref:Integrase core domain containing protein n=1 Tax=Solanum tuberosum TaxID=4113 RepID=M1DM17_SOLTU